MKNFIILIIQLFGYVAFFVALLSFLNFMFDWNLGYRGSEVPGEIGFAIAFVVLGIITSAIGWFLNRRYSV